jgi:hypothetical protein
MDYVTRQFINLTKKFRKDLRKYVSGLDRALDKHTEAIRESYQASENKQSPSPEVTILNHYPESIQVRHNAKDTRDERAYRLVTVFVTATTLGAIVVYAALVYWQWKEMIKATGVAQQAVVEAQLNRLRSDKAFNATVEQFRLDQRAWIVPSFPAEPISIVNGRMVSRLIITNSGKTPAIDFTMNAGAIFIGPSDNLPSDSPHLGHFKMGTVFPNSPRSYGLGVVETVDGKTGGMYLNDTVRAQISDGKKVILGLGNITYRDIFDSAEHSITFCDLLEGNFTVTGKTIPSLQQQCYAYNRILK